MERFQQSNPCPQCDGLGASFKRHDFACPEIGAAGEHVHRICPFCSFEWAEATRTPPRHAEPPSGEADEIVDLAALEGDAADLEAVPGSTPERPLRTTSSVPGAAPGP
jgi:hypothetical protein